MARKITLAQLRDRAKRAADMENRDFVSDTEWRDLINESCLEFFDLLIERNGVEYFLNPTPFAINIVAGTGAYDLPADFYKFAGVDVFLANQWATIERFNFNERNRYNYTPAIWGSVNDVRYNPQGGKLAFLPVPNAASQARVWYVGTKLFLDQDGTTPIAAFGVDASGNAVSDTVADAQQFDGINGWEQWPILAAAIDALHKEGKDTADLERRLARAWQRIQDLSNKDQANPAKMVDCDATGSPFAGW